MEGLGKHNEIESSIRRLTVFEGGSLDTDALRRGHPCHAIVRLDGEHVRAGFRQLCSRGAGSSSDVERADAVAGDAADNE